MLPAHAVLAALSLAVATPAFAGTVVPVESFRGLDIHGGGTVVLKHGAVQRVTILEGSTEYSTVKVNHGTLEIAACGGDFWRCPWHYNLRVEIVTPEISAIEVHGGGDLTSVGPFPQQKNLAISVHGGGDVDLRSIPALNVNAEVHGGGDLRTRAEQSLTASVYGGGDLTYWGNPPKLRVSTHGGGEISRGS